MLVYLRHVSGNMASGGLGYSQQLYCRPVPASPRHRAVVDISQVAEWAVVIRDIGVLARDVALVHGVRRHELEYPRDYVVR